jgi:hypothetical protein
LTPRSPQNLESLRREIGLSRNDLYWRYFALGGSVDRTSVGRFLDGQEVVMNPAELNILIQAVNERCVETGLQTQVPYAKH